MIDRSKPSDLCSTCGKGRPSTANVTPTPRPFSGSPLVRPAPRTPGRETRRSRSSLRKDWRNSRELFRPPTIVSRKVSRPPGWNPRLAERRLTKLRISSPEPISTSTASATSDTTRALRSSLPGRPAVPPRPPSVRAAFRFTPDARIAGRIPNRIPVASEAPKANTKSRASNRASWSLGMLSGPSRAASSVAPRASTSPAAPPASDRIVLSARSCPAMRPRVAPMAARTASSFRRPVPRASSKLATLAQAISSSNPTAPARISRGWRAGPRAA